MLGCIKQEFYDRRCLFSKKLLPLNLQKKEQSKRRRKGRQFTAAAEQREEKAALRRRFGVNLRKPGLCAISGTLLYRVINKELQPA